MKTFLAILATWAVCMAIGASNAYAWGTTYQTYGNLTYGSDGSRYQTYGNTVYATFPNRVQQGGLDANIILDGARNQPDFANTILQGQAIAAQREAEYQPEPVVNYQAVAELKQQALYKAAKAKQMALSAGVPKEELDAWYKHVCDNNLPACW
jgi:hypothetical protein